MAPDPRGLVFAAPGPEAFLWTRTKVLELTSRQPFLPALGNKASRASLKYRRPAALQPVASEPIAAAAIQDRA